VLLEEPDSNRPEVNFVLGTGPLAEGSQFNPGTGYSAAVVRTGLVYIIYMQTSAGAVP